MITKRAGAHFEGFIAIIEDLEDPKKLGRVRIRVIGHHDYSIPTEDLDWAMVLMPSSAAVGGLGTSPTWYKVGTSVVGFYIDGKTRMLPVIIGALNKIPSNDDNYHSVSKLAREEDTFEQKKLGPEPPVSYAAKYPHNKTITTDSGHVIEIDDTPDNERFHIRHKAGTYIEIDKDGRVVIRCKQDSYEIVEGDKHVYVKGNMFVQVKGDMKTLVEGATTQTTIGTSKLVAGDVLDMSGKTGVRVRSKNDVTVKAKGGLNATESGIMAIGPIQSGVGVTGTFTSATGQQIQVTKGIVSNITRV